MLTKHENTASFMAAAYGEMMGRPGVCLSTLGPGATNMATGVAHAYLDRSPVLAITGQLSTSRLLRIPHQRLDLKEFYRPITKWSARARAEGFADLMTQAISIATAPRQGPVHLEFTSDVAKQPALEGEIPPPPESPYQAVTGEQQIAEAISLVDRARAPAILAGLGALRSSRQVRVLAERLQAPVVTTPKAKGVFPEDHPLWAGVVEMAGDKVVFELLATADLLIAVGFDVVELDKAWILDVPILHIDAIPDAEGFYPITLELTGDIKTLVAGFAWGVGGAKRWPLATLADHRARLRESITPPGGNFPAYRLLETLRRLVPREAVITCDTGAHKMLAGQLWLTYEPGTFLVSNGLSSMGYAFPTAMVAKLVYPPRPVVALVGDGGFSMYLGELETAVRLQLPLVIVVFVDGCLSLVRMGQERKGYPPVGTSFQNPDFIQVVRAFGADGGVVESAEECEAAVGRAFASKGPFVIEAHINPSAYRLNLAPSEPPPRS